MSTTLQAIFNVISANVYFVIVIFNIHCRKVRFSASSPNSITEKSIFGHLEVIFLNVYFFPGWRWLFCVSTFREKFSDEKMSTLAGLKKSYSISCKSTDYSQNILEFHKILKTLVRGGC